MDIILLVLRQRGFEASMGDHVAALVLMYWEARVGVDGTLGVKPERLYPYSL